MGLVDRRLGQVNRGIDGGPLHTHGQVFPEIRAIRADVNADGRRSVRLYSDDYGRLMIPNNVLVWASPSEKTVTPNTIRKITRLGTPIDRYGEPDEQIRLVFIASTAQRLFLLQCRIEYAASEDPDDVVRVHCVETNCYTGFGAHWHWNTIRDCRRTENGWVDVIYLVCR